MSWREVLETLNRCSSLLEDCTRKARATIDAAVAPACDDATRARVEAVLERYQVDSPYATLVDALVHAVRGDATCTRCGRQAGPYWCSYCGST